MNAGGDPSVTPVARALYLCDTVIGYENGNTDLYGVFNALRPSEGYPHVRDEFCVYAHLVNGLGRVACRVDIRFAADGRLVHTTNVYPLQFANRKELRRLVIRVQGCPFPKPGLYLVELCCDNNWVADTTVILHDPQGSTSNGRA